MKLIWIYYETDRLIECTKLFRNRQVNLSNSQYPVYQFRYILNLLLFLLYRDLHANRVSYVMSETAAKSIWFFKIRAQRWIGSPVALFEPENTGRLKNVSIIASEQPFIPVSLDDIEQICQPFQLDYADSTTPKSSYVENADISIAHPNVVVGRGALLCDSQHEEGECPAPVSDEIDRRIVRGKFSSDTANMRRATFKSSRFTDLFLTPLKTKVSRH